MLISEYKKNTRPFSMEEPFDFLIYRPLAFVVVMLTKALPLNPNHYSLMALLSAIYAGVQFSHGDIAGLWHGGIGVFLFSVFDCCDGMIARLKKNGSELGEIIDMFVDLVSNIFFYVGLYLGLTKNLIPNQYPWLVFISALSILLNATIYNFFKKQYLAYYNNRPNWKSDEAIKYHEIYDRLKGSPRNYFWCFLIRLSFGFSAAQKNEDEIIKYNGREYISKNKKLLPMWAISSGSSHLTFLSLFTIFANIDYFYFVTIAFFGLWPIFMLVLQKIVNSKVEVLA